MMGNRTNIEWTDVTWNLATGCSKVSEGCRNCYAERMAKRLQAMGNPRYADGFEVTLHDDLVDAPRRWRKPKMIFVCSMSDLFHERVPVTFVERVFATMEACPQHTFQVLTKRSRYLQMVVEYWPPNVWMGVSVEDEYALHRIYELRAVPARVRFLSCEPLIGPLGVLPLEGIHWVIVGGETGPGARPMERDWVTSIHRQCQQAEVPFFFKRWSDADGLGKATARLLDGRTYDEMPTAGQEKEKKALDSQNRVG